MFKKKNLFEEHNFETMLLASTLLNTASMYHQAQY